MRIDATGSLRPERETFLELLQGLSADEWEAPTECPAWTVKGIALHVLGDDLSLLARQRDEATNGLVLYARDHPGQDFRRLLDGFNEQWVTAAAFLSPELVIALLERSGEWTAAYYGGADLDAANEPVGWFGATGPSPLWQAVARELVERWAHQHQVRRAVGRPMLDGPLADLVERVCLAGGAARLAALDAHEGDVVEVRMGERPWTLARGAEGWELYEGPAPGARATVAIAAAEVANLLTIGPHTAAETTTYDGDVDLALAVGIGVAPPANAAVPDRR